ncbi:MAG: GNAT family N-acetyltransferase [Fibrobacter sp.]|nr:GNAT family N-acetyltransferase [Fibrobacter sp.]
MKKCSMFDIATVSISEATTDDIYSIFFLQKRAFVQEAEINGGNYGISPIKQTLNELTQEFSNYLYLKAVVNNTIIGSVRAVQIGDTCQIGRLMTEPVFQNFGLGTILMHAIETAFPKVKRFELFTGEASTGNVRFYLNRGFRIFDKKEDVPGVWLVMFEKSR